MLLCFPEDLRGIQMSLSKKDIHDIKENAKNIKFLDKGFGHFYVRGLIVLAAIIILISIVFIVGGIYEYIAWKDLMIFLILIFFLLLFLFSLLMGMFWWLLSFQRRLLERRMIKKNITRKQYKEALEEDNSVLLPEFFKEWVGRYQVDQLQSLSVFRVPEKPIIYEKIGSWLGWGGLDQDQKREKTSKRLGTMGVGAALFNYWIAW